MSIYVVSSRVTSTYSNLYFILGSCSIELRS